MQIFSVDRPIRLVHSLRMNRTFRIADRRRRRLKTGVGLLRVR
jgi:hypothetical protein